MLILFELALLIQLGEQVLRLERLLRLSLLEFKLLLELTVLLLKLFTSLLLAQFLFFQFSELRSRSSALRANLEHVNALAVRC